LFLNAGFNAGLILKTETKNRKLPFPVFDLKGIKVPSLPASDPAKKQNSGTSGNTQQEKEKQHPLVKINEIKPSIEKNLIQIAVSADFNVRHLVCSW
jgi:hypothetical protein